MVKPEFPEANKKAFEPVRKAVEAKAWN